MSDPDYCYPPDFRVLRNKLGIRDPRELDLWETEFVMERIAQGVPTGDFDLAHLRAIHRHLFQDLYEWAGELRTVEISKAGHQFQFRRFIETGMADIHRRLVQRDSSGIWTAPPSRAKRRTSWVTSTTHPFREGNGRTQLLYLEQLASQAHHRLDLTAIGAEASQAASREAHFGRYEAMADCIAAAVLKRRDG
jgi:cell filamentation protein